MPSSNNVLWEGKHQEGLEELIKYLIFVPIMAHPDINSPFVLHTDASEKGVGSSKFTKKTTRGIKGDSIWFMLAQSC